MTDSSKPTKAKSVKAKIPSSHPKYNDMVVSAIKSLGQRGGSSKSAIMKYISTNYEVGNNVPQINGNIKRSLKQCVETSILVHPKGSGASGSFKVSKVVDKSPKVKKPAKVAAKKTPKKAVKKSKTKKLVKAVKTTPTKTSILKPKQSAKKVKKPIKQKITVKKGPAKKPTTKKAAKK